MERKITFGDYSTTVTRKLNGLSDPLVIQFLREIKKCDWTDFELYTHGSILSERPASDLDLTIRGPQNPLKVNQLLEDCIRIGYSLGIDVDVKFLMSAPDFDWKTHKPGETHTCTYASYKGEIQWGDQFIDFARYFSGYWISTRDYPMTKSKDSPYSPFKLI